jgi:hypothetical protein
MAARRKRERTTATVSASADRALMDRLRELSDRAGPGDLSELIVQIALQLARETAAAELLRQHGRREALEKEIAAELAAQRRRPARRRRPPST